ncbi:hypothetical protein [Tenacibaculum sp.]|uniref:hypothetical protein n=1 Tax=Tenacibaculum sp. TaxID=1906242 RepID=UPI003AA89A77
MILQNLKIGYDFRFDPIKAYLESTQEMIISQEKELEKKFRKWNEEHSENPEMPDAFDIYEMEILNSSEFPNILNKSVYLTIYSMFENEFTKLCEWCQHSENLSLGPKDLKGGNYIGQCRNYIIKVLNVNLENLKEQWNKIGNYQQIRNVIAHNNGIVKLTNKEIPKFVNKTKGISIEQKTSEIQIESIDFLIDFIDHLVGFLNETIEEIVNQKEKSST